MNWNDLTVWQYQQIYPIVTKPEKDWTNLDVESKLVGILYNITDTQVDSLSVGEFNKMKATLGFLDDKIEGKPVKYTEVNGKRYRFIYDVQQIKAARYIESKVFSTDLVGNIHKLAASMVMPQRKTWYGRWVDEKYDSSKHSGLFGQGNDESGNDIGVGTKGGSNFMRDFGWQYCAKSVADHENISVDESYELTTIQFLNTLSYLKAKADYDKEQHRKLK